MEGLIVSESESESERESGDRIGEGSDGASAGQRVEELAGSARTPSAWQMAFRERDRGEISSYGESRIPFDETRLQASRYRVVHDDSIDSGENRWLEIPRKVRTIPAR